MGLGSLGLGVGVGVGVIFLSGGQGAAAPYNNLKGITVRRQSLNIILPSPELRNQTPSKAGVAGGGSPPERGLRGGSP